MRKFYEIYTNGREANIDIYGDISSKKENWWTGDENVTSKGIKAEIDELDVDVINVFINSYGGEVAEALAIYSALKRHSAKIHTYCDGFACSAATIIFCAGEERTMGSIALLMIHNAMSYLGYANSKEMRKAAEDIDKINQSSVEAYKLVSNLSEDEIKEMMDAETWLTAEECLEYGFATDIAETEEDENNGAKQAAQKSIREAILARNTANPTNAEIVKAIEELGAKIEMSATQEEPEKPVEPDDGNDAGDDEENGIEVDPKEPDDENDEPEESAKQRAARFFAKLK